MAAGRSSPGNAVSVAARRPTSTRLFADGPRRAVKRSGLAVGLPEGQMGNSEVGHLNIGAGRVVYQELTRINLAIEDGSLLRQRGARRRDRRRGRPRAGRCTSWASSPTAACTATSEHLYALVEMAAPRREPRSCVHGFLDGRDTPPQSGLGYVERARGEIDA